MSFRSKDDIFYVFNGSLIDLPSPSSLSYFWNFGSLLGIFLFFQIMTGLFLSLHFISDMNLSFFSVVHMMRDVHWGWFLRILHANGASFFFFFIYIHIGRGIYYGSCRFMKTWLSGVSIFLLSMATAFLGYVLPWGQMSFWAATVITNLFSAIPYIGVMLVEWIWGGFAVGNPTLVRFFAFHFILPFIILFFVILHLMFLHITGSQNSLGLSSVEDKFYFYPYYVMKDIFGFFFVLLFFVFFCFYYPYMFMDVENFILSNPLVTPTHIQPEWYFLFAYSVLRSVPSKIGGVIFLLLSVLILYFMPFFFKNRFSSFGYNLILKLNYWIFFINWMLLTWIGSCEVEMPFSIMGVYFSLFYFILFMIFWLLGELQDIIFDWL